MAFKFAKLFTQKFTPFTKFSKQFNFVSEKFFDVSIPYVNLSF